jgi:hypothetical protein
MKSITLAFGIALAVVCMPLAALAQDAEILSREQIITRIIVAARERQLDPATALAVAEKESSFNPKARRWEKKLKTASLGLFQILLTTARQELEYVGSAFQMYDPETNIQLGLAYIQRCYAEVGSSLADLSCCYQAGFYVKQKRPATCRMASVREYGRDVLLKRERWRVYLQGYEQFGNPDSGSSGLGLRLAAGT